MTAIIDYRGRTPRKVSSGIPLITAKIVKGGRIMTPTEFIAAEDYDPWMRRGIPQSGDVVVTTEAPLGEVAQLNHQRVALAQRLILLRGKSRVLDNRFLKYLMQSEGVQDQLYGLATGTTVTGIKQGELRQIELALPPIFEQEAIAHILGTLDDKIELNRRMNATLEATARALFRSWFVDFHPVRAKMERPGHGAAEGHRRPVPGSNGGLRTGQNTGRLAGRDSWRHRGVAAEGDRPCASGCRDPLHRTRAHASASGGFDRLGEDRERLEQQVYLRRGRYSVREAPALLSQGGHCTRERGLLNRHCGTQGEKAADVRLCSVLCLISYLRHVYDSDFDRHEDAANELANHEQIRAVPADGSGRTRV